MKLQTIKEGLAKGKKLFYYEIKEFNSEHEYRHSQWLLADSHDEALKEIDDYISDWYPDAEPSNVDDGYYEISGGCPLWCAYNIQELKTVDDLIEMLL